MITDSRPCPCMMCQTSKWSRTADPVPVWCAKHQSDHGEQILSLYDVPNIKVTTDSSSWLCGELPLNIMLDQSICVKTSSVFGWYPCAVRVRVYILTWCGIQFAAFKKNCSLLNANSAFPLTIFHLLDRYLVSAIEQRCQLKEMAVMLSHYSSGQVLTVPGGSGSQISRQSAHEGGKVVSPTHRPPLAPRKYSWNSFVRAWVNQCDRKDYVNGKFSMTLSGIEPATFSGFSAVPQPTAPPRAPHLPLCTFQIVKKIEISESERFKFLPAVL